MVLCAQAQEEGHTHFRPKTHVIDVVEVQGLENEYQLFDTERPGANHQLFDTAAQKRRIKPRLNSLNLGPRGSGPTPAVVYMSCKADMYPSTEFTVCPRVK